MTYLKNKISAFLRFLLITLFIGYYSSITLFYHTHLVNGVVIVHSHPFKSSNNNQNPVQSHSHSSASYVVIDHLMQANWEGSPEIPQVPEPVFFQCENKVDFTSTLVPSDICFYAQLRAPPIG